MLLPILSVRAFSLNRIINFSKFWHGASNPYEVVLDRAGFSRKIAPKIGKMGQKQCFFKIYWKIYSLIFSEFALLKNFIIFVVFLHKSYTWEKSGS